jgi:hypothetical protein
VWKDWYEFYYDFKIISSLRDILIVFRDLIILRGDFPPDECSARLSDANGGL